MAKKNKNPIGFAPPTPKKQRFRLFSRKSKGRYSGTHIGFTGDLNSSEPKVPFSDRWKSAQDSTRAGVGGLRLVLTIVFFILLVSMLTRMLTGSDSIPTFAGFLNYLQDAPEVQIPYINFSEVELSTEDWGIFEFLRRTIVFFLQSLNITVFLINGLMSVVTYIVFVFKWLFLA